MQSHRSLTLVALASLAAAPLIAQSTSRWLPNGVAAQSNSNNSYPWNRGTGPTAQIRIQFQYANANFAGITTPIVIREIRFRAWDRFTTTWTGGTYSNVQIGLSTAATPYTAMSRTFAANQGPDLTQVYTGPVTIQAGTHNGVGFGPTYITIALARPFLFDPSAGKDLNVDIRHDGATVAGMSSAHAAHYSGSATSSTPALCARVYDLADWNAASATGATTDFGAAMEIGYAPARGLSAAFLAAPTSGGQNLTVRFTDTSVTTDPGGVKSWAWDFGDGSPISNVQHPTHTYRCGRFSPKLTVTDAVNPPQSVTMTDLISAGVVAAGFDPNESLGVAPFQVTFTDTSTGGAVAWEWDFGDGSPKSTVQNPAHVYTRAGTYTVTLKATGGCNSDTEVARDPIVVCSPGGNSSSLTTGFSGGSGLTSNNAGNMFRVTVVNPDGIKVTSIDVNSRAAATTNIDVDVYVTPDTYEGNNARPAIWVRTASGSAASAGGLTPTPVDISDFYLAPGSYGVYVVMLNGGVHYSPGTSTNLVYQNCDLRIENGYGLEFFSPIVNEPRVWNGTLRYARNDAAASGKYGYGCAGSNRAVPDLSIDPDPTLGGTVTVRLANMTNAAAVPGFLFLGTRKQIVDLTRFGMPGCYLHTDTKVTLPLLGVNGVATQTAGILNNPAFLGVQILMQASATDAAANPLGYAASNGLQLRLGR